MSIKQPMKKIDTLNAKKLKPKKSTVNFLLNFSKSLEVIRTKAEVYRITKN